MEDVFSMTGTLKPKFLEKYICYYCGEYLHNYELSELFDGRIVKACFECYDTVEIGKRNYYSKNKRRENE